MENYKTLIAALYPYRSDIDLDNAQRHCLLEKDIEADFIDLNCLKAELNRALSEAEFNWVVFAKENLLVMDSSDATEIATYVASLLQGFVPPKQDATG